MVKNNSKFADKKISNKQAEETKGGLLSSISQEEQLEDSTGGSIDSLGACFDQAGMQTVSQVTTVEQGGTITYICVCSTDGRGSRSWRQNTPCWG